MATDTTIDLPSKIDWIQLAHELGQQFSERSDDHDAKDQFVEDNFKDLKKARAFSMQIPEALGGGGLSYEDTCYFHRILGQYCSSTALAFSMHNHLLATTLWKYHNQNAPLEPFLKKIAAEQLVLISSGGSDWLDGSGKAVKVDGGYRYSGRKIFSSGSPIGDILMTMGVMDDPEKGAQVIHFPVSFKSPELKVLNTWKVMGMRGTGSHDLEIADLFVPDSAIQLTRAKGKWHPAMHLVALRALPIIYSVYMGIADAARMLALKESLDRRENGDLQLLAGEMENEYHAAALAWKALVQNGIDESPSEAATHHAAIFRTLLAQSAIRAVERAMMLMGGKGFYRDNGMERLFRDIQAAKYHPLQEKPQLRYAGRFIFGLPV